MAFFTCILGVYIFLQIKWNSDERDMYYKINHACWGAMNFVKVIANSPSIVDAYIKIQAKSQSMQILDVLKLIAFLNN